jgi:hypothetical protein
MRELLLILFFLACCSVRLSSADDQSHTIRDENGKIIGRIDSRVTPKP